MMSQIFFLLGGLFGFIQLVHVAAVLRAGRGEIPLGFAWVSFLFFLLAVIL